MHRKLFNMVPHVVYTNVLWTWDEDPTSVLLLLLIYKIIFNNQYLNAKSNIFNYQYLSVKQYAQKVVQYGTTCSI